MRWFAVLLLVSAAHAATWIPYARGDDAIWEYTPELITHHDNRGLVLVVWTRTRTSMGDTAKSRYEIHCASRSTRLINQVRFDGPDVAYQLTDPQARWNYATPDSAEMALVDATCPYYR